MDFTVVLHNAVLPSSHRHLLIEILIATNARLVAVAEQGYKDTSSSVRRFMYRNITVPTTASLQNDLKVVTFSKVAMCISSTLHENTLGAASAASKDENCHHRL